ncbi:hypothetical protein OSSY52_04300 [Tepiditoga spiralis]|uniref:DNA 3'-5' helicase n=1 Tax=Tepiditoga spiralis TaxID=2108365 RepID=A0A7G1GA60_9BACT|nr:UvrD-helicase domain-containing protein [Tepiditoga spiralis]BBE30289.1 hypothetical protein OSSY52_04300 [Tepiditoga spiralis]
MIIKKITDNPNRNFFISASAGTGKTYTLTQYYMSILEKNKDSNIIDKILAVTFTNKAAGEMRERITESIYEKMNAAKTNKEYEYWNEVKISLSGAWIKTIDSFCSRILKDNNVLIGVDPNFTMISEFKKENEIERAVYYTLKVILETYENIDPDLINLSTDRKNNVEKILLEFKKDKEFKKIVKEFLKNEGIKKFEELLKEMVRNWRLEMKRAIVETMELSENGDLYTNFLKLLKNASYIASEFYESLTIDQFKYDFKGILEKTILTLENNNILKKYQNKFKYIIVDEYQDTNYLQKEIFDKLHHENNYLFYVGDRKQSIYRFRGADVSVFSKTENEFKNKNYIVESLNTNRRSNSEIVSYINKLSKDVLFEKNNIYMDDVESELFESICFKEIDECNYEIKENKNITPNLLKDDNKRIKYIYATPEKDNKELRVKKEAETIIKTIKNLLNKEMTFRKRKNGKIIFETRKIKPGDIALLLKQLSGYEEILKNEFQKNNIPYYIVGGKSFYYKPEVQAVFSALSAVQNPYNDYEFIKYMMSLIGGMTLNQLHTLIKNKKNSLFETFETIEFSSERLNRAYLVLKKYRNLRYYMKPTDILKGIIKETKYLVYLMALDNSESAISNVKKLITGSQQYDSIANTFSELVKLLKKSTEVDEKEAVLEDEKSNSVKIMTIHKSKGLEFPIVLLGGLHNKIDKKIIKNIDFSLPNSNGERYYLLKNVMKNTLNESSNYILKWFKNNDFLEKTETNRLIYVATTRAKEMLIPILINTKSNSYNNYFFNYKYDNIDKINEIDLKDIKINNKIEEIIFKDIPKNNLKNLKNLAYKQYIAPTYLINEPKESEEKFLKNIGISYKKYFKQSVFSDEELMFRGSQLHLKLQSAPSLIHLKKLIDKEKNRNYDYLPPKFDELNIVKKAFGKNEIVKTEWRLVKKIEINNKEYMLFGIPDRVLINNGNIEVIDYKFSDLLNKNKIKDYIFQLQFYMYLLKDFGYPKKGYILSIKETKEPIEVTYNNDIELEIINKIKKLQI